MSGLCPDQKSPASPFSGDFADRVRQEHAGAAHRRPANHDGFRASPRSKRTQTAGWLQRRVAPTGLRRLRAHLFAAPASTRAEMPLPMLPLDPRDHPCGARQRRSAGRGSVQPVLLAPGRMLALILEVEPPSSSGRAVTGLPSASGVLPAPKLMAAASGGRSGCQPSMLPARSEERAPAADAASASNATSSRYCISVMLCRESPSVSGATGIRGRWIQQGTPGRGQRAGLLAGSQAGVFLLEDHRVMFGTIRVITPASRLATARSRSSDQSGMPARASDVPRLRRTRSVRASGHAKVIHSVDVQGRRCRCGGGPE
jgi:hypothetical protein